eukprot:COSAG02_NODE_387_length_23294_cov_52.630610_14_plen_269_part_00
MPTSIVGWLTAQGLGDAARIKQWDAITQKLGHNCGLQNTLLELSQLEPSVIANIAERMELDHQSRSSMMQAHQSLSDLTDKATVQLAVLGEIFGDVIKGRISEACDLQNLTESLRRKAKIPNEATHFVWAYQAEGGVVGAREGFAPGVGLLTPPESVESEPGCDNQPGAEQYLPAHVQDAVAAAKEEEAAWVDVESFFTDEQKRLIDTSSGEFSFVSQGSFIYFKAGAADRPMVLGMNALGVGESLHSGTIDRDGVRQHTAYTCHPVA